MQYNPIIVPVLPSPAYTLLFLEFCIFWGFWGF